MERKRQVSTVCNKTYGLVLAGAAGSFKIDLDRLQADGRDARLSLSLLFFCASVCVCFLFGRAE